MTHGESTTHPLQELSAFVDGELRGDERREVEQHLRDCAACRELVDDLQAIDRAAATVAPPAVPADLAGRIRALLDAAAAPGIPASTAVPSTAVPLAAADRARQRKKLWRQAMPFAAAASLLAAVLVWRAWPERIPYRSGPSPIAESAPPREYQPVSPALTAPATPPAPPARSAPPAQATGSEPRRLQDKRKVAANQPVDTMREVEMKSLGYLAAKPTAMADGGAARDAAAPAPASVATAPAAGVAAAAAEAAAPSVLRYKAAPAPIRAEPYLIRLLDDRRLAVEHGTYSCFVQVSEEDGRQIAAFIEEATSAAKATTAPAKEEAFGGTIPSASPEARQALLRMVRERYRPALEARCGPLPQ